MERKSVMSLSLYLILYKPLLLSITQLIVKFTIKQIFFLKIMERKTFMYVLAEIISDAIYINKK